MAFWIAPMLEAIGKDVNSGASLAAFNYGDYSRNPWDSMRASNGLPDYPEQLRAALMNARNEGQTKTSEEDPLIQYLRDMINGRGNTAWE